MSWPLIKLGNICDLLNGYAFKSDDYVDGSNTLSCRMSNIRPGGQFDIDYNARYLPDNFAEKYEQFLLKNGDVVIAMTDLADSPKILGVPTIIKTNGKNILLNQRVGKLVIKDKNKVHFPYLQLALNAPEVRSIYKRFAGGGLQINLGKADLLSVEVPLPPLPEQQKIAAILNAADSLRQKDRQLIEKYTALSQSLFLDMFGDPVTNPMEFPEGTVRDLVSEVKYGTSAKSEEGGKYPYLRMNNITYQGYMDFSNLKYINITDTDKQKYAVQKGDILFNRTNSKELVGKTGIFDLNTEMIIAGYLIRVRTNKYANPYYIWAYLNSTHGKLILVNMCKNIVGMANINAQELQDIKILIPPVSLQTQFAERIQAIEAQKQLAQASLEKSEALFNSLLQRAFTGELTEQRVYPASEPYYNQLIL